MRYKWDPAKAKANIEDHSVSFVEAVTVLEDDFALTREDSDTLDEQRFVTSGMSGVGNLLIVVYTYREPDVIWLISAWKANKPQRSRYEKTVAEPYREIDFARAKRGAVVPLEPGKTKISIRLNNTVLDYFRAVVENAGGGNYQTLINDALVAYTHQQSLLDAVRQVVREEFHPSLSTQSGITRRSTGRAKGAARRST